MHSPKAVVHHLYIHLGRPSAFGAAQGWVTVDIGEEGGVYLSPGYRMAMMSGSVRCDSSSSLGSRKTGGRRRGLPCRTSGSVAKLVEK